ncbi:MAG TPA: hypothetical protein VMA95_13495 [Streptosporangiaceae bacterium]|nr:hypothetical protein [Streptosporangiaceae bacterium]
MTAALVVLALLAGGGMLVLRPGTYQAQASVVLLASKSAARLTGGNPYLSFTPSLSLAADVVSRSLMAPQTASELAGRGYTSAFTVGPPTYATTTTGSVLVISVTGGDQAGVESTLHAVIRQVGDVLAQIQAGMVRQDRITEVTLSASPRAALAESATLRPVLMTEVVALLLALSVPLVVDGMARRRARRNAHQAGSGGRRRTDDRRTSGDRRAAGGYGAGQTDWDRISAR